MLTLLPDLVSTLRQCRAKHLSDPATKRRHVAIRPDLEIRSRALAVERPLRGLTATQLVLTPSTGGRHAGPSDLKRTINEDDAVTLRPKTGLEEKRSIDDKGRGTARGGLELGRAPPGYPGVEKRLQPPAVGGRKEDAVRDRAAIGGAPPSDHRGTDRGILEGGPGESIAVGDDAAKGRKLPGDRGLPGARRANQSEYEGPWDGFLGHLPRGCYRHGASHPDAWKAMVPDMNDAAMPIRVHVAVSREGVPILPIAAALLRMLHGENTAPPPDSRIYGAWEARLRSGRVVRGSERDADVVLCAHDAVTQCLAAQGVARQAKAGIPVLMHTEADDVRPTEAIRGVLWRSSAFRSRLRPHERIATGCVPDLVGERTPDDPDTVPWAPVPAVGFIGHVASGLRSLGYLRRGWQHYYGFTLRERVLRELERSATSKADLLRRSRNLGPPMTGVDRDASIRSMRREYVRSVFANPYSLCVRGAGNWSYRLFESLSAGRIPLLVDTDCALPLEDEVPWESHLCRVPIGKLASIGRILAEFHGNLGPQGLLEMQRRNRQLWLDRLEPGAFFEHALRQTAATRASAADATRSRPAGHPSR